MEGFAKIAEVPCSEKMKSSIYLMDDKVSNWNAGGVHFSRNGKQNQSACSRYRKYPPSPCPCPPTIVYHRFSKNSSLRVGLRDVEGQGGASSCRRKAAAASTSVQRAVTGLALNDFEPELAEAEAQGSEAKTLRTASLAGLLSRWVLGCSQ